ncbi:unnamed protein product, partial [Adineta ricciae]
LDIKLTSDNNYPEIKWYVNHRTSLISLEIDGTLSITSTNITYSNLAPRFYIVHSGTGILVLELEHDSDIIVTMSGTG